MDKTGVVNIFWQAIYLYKYYYGIKNFVLLNVIIKSCIFFVSYRERDFVITDTHLYHPEIRRLYSILYIFAIYLRIKNFRYTLYTFPSSLRKKAFATLYIFVSFSDTRLLIYIVHLVYFFAEEMFPLPRNFYTPCLYIFIFF